jgi:CDP-diacylglycerol--glycerol-3-phosphate 3-phosphatidyltransferase
MGNREDRIFTISNGISLFRAFLAIPIVIALENDHLKLGLAAIILAIISDFLDGFLARISNSITNLGKLLDPIADKIIILAVMIFLIFSPEHNFPIYFFLLLGARDLTISIIVSYLMNRQSEIFESNFTGKVFVAIVALGMTLYVLRYVNLGFWTINLASLVLIMSWMQYLRRYLRYFKTLPNL